jgi:diguanylate cyclase (GGDEF)-like protein
VNSFLSGGHDDAYRIDRLTAEFYSPETEEKFQEYVRPRWLHETRYAIRLAALFYLVFAITDFLMMGYGEEYLLVLLIRVAVAGLGLTVAYLSGRYWRQMVSGKLPTMVASVAMAGFIVKTLYVPHDYGAHGMGMMAMLLGVYAFIPNRFIYRLTVSGLTSVAFLIVMMTQYGLPVGPLSYLTTLLVVTNVLGIMVAWRRSMAMHETFTDHAVLKAANERLEREAEVRQRLEASLRKRADVDDTTGVANRATLFERANRMIIEAKETGHPLALVLLDIDYFKQLNGTYGHMCGDDVLRTVVSAATAMLKPGCFLARLGGEEFVILMPDTQAEEAARLADRIRAECQRMPVDKAEITVHFTLSGGVAMWCPGESINVLLRRADEAVSAAKYKGRNRVELAA